MKYPFVLVAMLGWLPIVVKADWDATDSLREYMRMRDPGETHSSSMAGLRGRTTTDGDLEKAMLSPRLATVQSAMEHALRSKDYDPALFKRVKNWYNELDRRTGLLKYCKSIRGQGWDGECLAVDNWWNSVSHKEFMAKPWQSH